MTFHVALFSMAENDCIGSQCDLDNYHIGFLGSGLMAKGIIKGLLNCGNIIFSYLLFVTLLLLVLTYLTASYLYHSFENTQILLKSFWQLRSRQGISHYND